MKRARKTSSDQLRPEYDLKELLKGGVRGKYAKSYHAGSNVVVLDPDVRDAFRSARAVNDALRLVIELGKVAGRARVLKNKRAASSGEKQLAVGTAHLPRAGRPA